MVDTKHLYLASSLMMITNEMKRGM